MRPETEATLERLRTSNWFDSVGTSFGISTPEKVQLLSCWDDAVVNCQSIEWQNLLLEAQNQFAECLLRRNRDRFSQWNVVTEGLKTIVVPLVEEKVKGLVEQYGLPKCFKDVVNWDILGVCREAEFSDVCSPGFFAGNAYWYVHGHFPCGWEGAFPAGKLIVF